MTTNKRKVLATMVLATLAGGANAFTFESGDIKGSFDSTITAGVGVRASAPGCNTIIGTNFTGPAAPTGSGAPAGCLDNASGYNDQGNLNYKKGQAFTSYLKGTHELLLKLPDDYKFMARVNWLQDFAAGHPSGYIGGANTTGQAFPGDAKRELEFKARLLDLWVSKEFDIAGQRARWRAGNQVISWGESLFMSGGINQTNAVDIMRLSQPGTQLKEALLPAPIVSVASGAGEGFNIEAYTQLAWNKNYFPPVGSYWSVATIGNGAAAAGTPTEKTPRNDGQFGVSLRYKPTDVQANFGLYVMRYHDKSPVLNFASPATPATPAPRFSYLEDRMLYGASVNFPLGNWAIGSELSYRPKDAVTLNANAVNNVNSGACLADGKCYVEEKKYQFHLTGLRQLMPGDDGPLLNLLGADSGLFMIEAAAVHYPKLKSTYQGVPVAAGQWGWGALNANDSWLTNGLLAGTNAGMSAVGDKTSWGYSLDFSWTYDGTLIPGWQVSPEIFYFEAVKGRTPNAAAMFMEGAKSANYILTFTQNPANWTVALNYATFWGGSSFYDQPFKNRDFYGISVSRNF
ncbi:MAG TPA: DUF1302 domain-containing protein [Rhodocyclaceae bacterium]|nr:DUF1302 domain-containing protein [Rhodocyclaceae bacterium]